MIAGDILEIWKPIQVEVKDQPVSLPLQVEQI
jgi:hypothetical protein